MADQVDIFVMRHAPTEWNEARRFQGSKELSVSERGREQARTWKTAVSSLNCVRAYVSPQVRALETLAIVAPQLEAVVLGEFRESSFGQWEGMTYEAVREWLAERGYPTDFQGLEFREHGGESLSEIIGRVKLGLAKIDCEGEPVLVVSHKTTIHAMYALATGWDALKKTSPRMRFPRIHHFVWNGEVLKIQTLNIPLIGELV
jgi:broad specificity phosphatase PhoE